MYIWVRIYHILHPREPFLQVIFFVFIFSNCTSLQRMRDCLLMHIRIFFPTKDSWQTCKSIPSQAWNLSKATWAIAPKTLFYPVNSLSGLWNVVNLVKFDMSRKCRVFTTTFPWLWLNTEPLLFNICCRFGTWSVLLYMVITVNANNVSWELCMFVFLRADVYVDVLLSQFIHYTLLLSHTVKSSCALRENTWILCVVF